jgi:hypothetical protein
MNEQADRLGFTSRARVTTKKLGVAPEGTLTLADGRLRFERRGRIDLDVPLEHVGSLRSPWYMIGAGFRFEANGRRWSCTFNKLTTVGAGMRGFGIAGELVGTAFTAIDLGGQWKLCHAWKDVFARAGILGADAAAAATAAPSGYMNASILAADAQPPREG